MAEKIVTVKTWDEFKNAMNTTINNGDTLIISIAADLTDTEQHALPTPEDNYWATITNDRTAQETAKLKIIGNNHTISGINIPPTYEYSALLNLSSVKVDISIYNLKFVNVQAPSVMLHNANGGGTRIHLIGCTITGKFELCALRPSSAFYDITQCNIVQLCPGNGKSAVLISNNIYFTHYYFTALAILPFSPGNRPIARSIEYSYIEIDPLSEKNLMYVRFDGESGKRITFNNSCINAPFEIQSEWEYIDAYGVTVFNCTNKNMTVPESLKDTIKIITDDQMKNADYLNSIGFTVTPTN